MRFPALYFGSKPSEVVQRLKATKFSVSSFKTFKSLIVSLYQLSKIEANLPCCLVVLVDVPAIAKKNCQATDLKNPSFSHVKQIVTTFFSHLNILVIDYNQIRVNDDSFLKSVETQVVVSHEFFLKNRFKRMKAWIGLDNPSSDISLSTFSHLLSKDAVTENKALVSMLSSLNECNVYNVTNYPSLPDYLPTMTTHLSDLLGRRSSPSNDHFAMSFDDYSHYQKLITDNINFEIEVLNISEERKFYIKEFLLESWNFPAHILSYDELVYASFLMFKRALKPFPQDSKIVLSDNQLFHFILKIREHYNGGNDFHNFRHAIDVCQAIFYYLLTLNILDKEALISKKIIIHNHKRSKQGKPEDLDWSVDKIIAFNEQTIDNNDSLCKESEEIDPAIEYSIYIKSPKLYVNQLKTYQNVIEQSFPRENVSKSEKTIVETEYGKLHQCCKSELFEPLEALALLLAALGHDSGHPGLTNNFISTNFSPLSTIFNDQSILENYHLISFNQVLIRYWPQLFDTSVTEKICSKPIDIKRIISKSILATDMERHFAFIDEMKNRERDAVEVAAEGEIPKLEVSAELLSQLLLKCADISNITRPLKLSATWGLILGKEMCEITKLDKILKYNRQLLANDESFIKSKEFIDSVKDYESVDEQAETILKQVEEVLGNNTIETPSGCGQSTLQSMLKLNPNLCKSQIFFIEKISYNLFRKINQILPWLGFILTILNKNLQFWKSFQVEKQVK